MGRRTPSSLLASVMNEMICYIAGKTSAKHLLHRPRQASGLGSRKARRRLAPRQWVRARKRGSAWMFRLRAGSIVEYEHLVDPRGEELFELLGGRVGQVGVAAGGVTEGNQNTVRERRRELL